MQIEGRAPKFAFLKNSQVVKPRDPHYESHWYDLMYSFSISFLRIRTYELEISTRDDLEQTNLQNQENRVAGSLEPGFSPRSPDNQPHVLSTEGNAAFAFPQRVRNVKSLKVSLEFVKFIRARQNKKPRCWLFLHCSHSVVEYKILPYINQSLPLFPVFVWLFGSVDICLNPNYK